MQRKEKFPHYLERHPSPPSHFPSAKPSDFQGKTSFVLAGFSLPEITCPLHRGKQQYRARKEAAWCFWGPKHRLRAPLGLLEYVAARDNQSTDPLQPCLLWACLSPASASSSALLPPHPLHHGFCRGSTELMLFTGGNQNCGLHGYRGSTGRPRELLNNKRFISLRVAQNYTLAQQAEIVPLSCNTV